jgi:flavorubredoxin
MKAIVLYDTLFGNTEKVAKSLAKGLRDRAIEVDCVNITSVLVGDIPKYDLLALGSPTREFTAAKPMKQFISVLKGTDLRGKLGFAFDTRIDNRLSGSAAKYIEGKLVGMGVKMVLPRASAFIIGKGPADQPGGTSLRPGTEEEFERLGRELGSAVLSKSTP